MSPIWSRKLRTLVPAVAVGALLTTPAVANNGAVALARPVRSVVIDGDLADWDGTHRVYPIERVGGEDAVGPPDAAASFRVAYNAEEGALYVGLEVEDDSYVPSSALGVEDWTGRDGHLLYVDREHRPRGSGNVLYLLSERQRDLVAAQAGWDPANGGGSWEIVEASVGRKGTRTVFEWRLLLGGDIAAGRTIGLDHIVVDRDADEEEATLLVWGEGFGKSSNSYRLGDVVLLGAGQEVGELTGSVEWAVASDRPLPSHVRVTRIDEPALWVQVDVGSDGRYRAELPAGRYRVSPAFSLSEPFRVDFGNLPLRIDQSFAIEAEVEANRANEAPPLAFRTFERPDFLFSEHPLLPGLEPDDLVALDTFIDAFRRYYDIPGVSVAVVHHGERVYHRTFGVRNSLTGARIESDTLFEGASITKAMFAMAVLRQVERELLDLDRPLVEYLPFELIAGDPRSAGLTARHVLTHHSGLPNWAWGGPGGWRDGTPIDLLFAPGSEYHYSGEAFNYLGRVLEAITGSDLESLLTAEVSRPMGLENSFYALDDARATEASLGHFSHHPVWRRRASEVSPASSLHSEAGDFANFLLGLVEGRGLGPEMFEAMLRPAAAVPDDWRVYPDAWPQSIGLGVFLRETPYGLLVEHGGNNDDFDSKFAVVPEAGFGYVVFTNSNVGDELIRALELYLLHGKS